jgi:hypothetical protein
MKTAALLSLGLLAPCFAAPTTSTKQAPKVPLARERYQPHKRADGSVNTDWLLSQLKNVARKYNKDFELPEIVQNAPNLIKRDTDANEALTDQVTDGEDTLYYGTGTIGSQSFTFDFDTGSSDTFVPGPSCGTAQGCVGTTKYDEDGTNLGNTTTITYGSGEVTGENYLDSLTVAGLTATNQNIISLTDAEGFADSASEGLIGMAFESIAESKEPPFFFTLINEGKVSPTEFSFYLGRNASGTGQDSELTLGGRDSSKYTGATTSVPLTNQTYWQVAVDGATVDSNAVSGTDGEAAIDTGTTLIVAPTAAALAIFSQVLGAIPLDLGSMILFAFPCASSPDIALTFAGTDFEVNPLDLNFGLLTTDLGLDLGDNILTGLYCVAGIAGADLIPGEEFYVVGK